MNNEFAVASMVHQRRDDMLAEAAADRLARQVPGRRGWWQRLARRFSQTHEPIARAPRLEAAH